jgi:hypothetical protein
MMAAARSRGGLVLFGLLAALAAAGVRAQNPPRVAAVPNPPAVPETLMIRAEGDSITAEIRAVPLQRVLEELAARTGLIFEVLTQWNPQVSVSLFKVGLEDAVRRVATGGDSIFYYERDAVGKSRIHFVRIFPRGMRGQPAGLVQIGTGAVTRSGDAVETADQALRALAESPKLETRQKAVEVLVATRSDAAIAALTQALSDRAVEVRVAAIEGLAGLNARAALPRIVELLKDAHPGVRESAVEAVALLGTTDNLKDLKPLTRDSDPGVAGAAELALRRLAGRRP